MKVIKINGVKSDSAYVQSVLEGYSFDNPIFIIDKNKELYKFIEELTIDECYLYILRVAREIEFSGIDVKIRNLETNFIEKDNILSFSELLEELNEYDLDIHQIIIDTEDKNFLSDVIQALNYLNLDIEVTMKKEKGERARVNAFKTGFYKLRRSIIKAQDLINEIEVIDELSSEKDNIVGILNKIKVNLDSAKERNLNISVMATKKSGKSVVVNSFLGEQYAPTSLELPTPNTCIYKKSINDQIRLVYGPENIYFDSPEEIYKYTYNEFKKAQNNSEEESAIDDMEIHYVKDSNDFATFTIIDTPGPNYAGANNSSQGINMHKRNAYKWIEKSDVVIFLVNYSNYLTTDEEEFFRDIKTQFEKHDKFYSLIVAVNKLDEMYMSECENKSVVRFLDYLRSKLNSLGYSGFIVLGISARSYFDIIKVSQLDSSELKYLGETKRMSQLSGDELRLRLKKLKRKYIGKNQMTVLSFVDDQLEKLECFQGLNDVSLNTLRERSGIPKLMDYTTYVAIQKANTELYSSIIWSIDELFVRLKNLDLVKSIIDAKIEKQEEIEEIENMLQKMMDTFDLIDKEINQNLIFTELQEDLISKINESREESIEDISDVYEEKLDRFFMRLRMKDKDDLREMKTKGFSIDLSVNNTEIEEELNALIGNILNTINSDIDLKENYFKQCDAAIKEIVHSFSEKIKKDYNLKDFIITVPKVDHAFNRKSLVKIPSINIDCINIKEDVLNSIDFRENFLEKCVNHFLENKIGTYSTDGKKLNEIKRNWIEAIKNSVEGEYSNLFTALEVNTINCIEDLKTQIYKAADSLTSTYKLTFSDMLKDLSISKMNVEEQMNYLDAKLQFFDQIEDKMSEFNDIWNGIRREQV
ncbi:dynamin family protein [Candidatus Clostridium stratigraminis]|uniref:Dynamin family protein n=1 Tax=Candidatus Clostridium stratigraminis TaxID=3381661 RepID=A0ABW8T5U2_9CLOT